MDSIHWSYPGPGESRVITVDAKQRHLIMVKDKGGQFRSCSEAAPETFGAYSSSIAAMLGIGAANRDAQIATATSEAVATLEHTQTVNLLRESMFRTCERWLSGALSQEEFLTLAARDHRSMVATLAIEQLTGVVRPRATIISGPAVRAAIKQNEELVKLLADYKDERKVAQAAEASAAKEARDAANVDYTSGGATVKVCSLAERPTDATAGPQWDKCKPTADKAKAAKDIADSARKRENSVLDQLSELSSAIGGGTEPYPAGQNGGGGDIPSRPTGEDLVALGKIVRDIVLTPGVDESLMFCIGYLHKSSSETSDDTRATCNEILARNATKDLQIKGQIFKFEPSAADEISSAARIRDYSGFQGDVQDLIRRTPPDKWLDFWQPFAALLTTVGPDCASKEKCANTWGRAFAYYPDYTRFPQQRRELEKAVENWNQQLNAIGR